MSQVTFKPADLLNRKEAANFLGISIYAVNWALIRKELKSLKFSDLKTYKPKKAEPKKAKPKKTGKKK